MWQLVLLALAGFVAADSLPPSCSKPIYCNSSLLHHMQMAELYSDSKTFVDLELLKDPNVTLADFDTLLSETGGNPTREQLIDFRDHYFQEANELEEWTPTDYSADPAFLTGIRDQKLRQFGKDINSIWPTLGRKIKSKVFDYPDRHSLVPVSNGFIIPGGRFKEIYYWDTYWIIEGLLISGMKETAKGMLDNFIQLLKIFGHIPNGSRWYYQERSQPPLLSAMMSLYIRETNDLVFLNSNIRYLEQELEYWLNTQIVTFEVDEKAYTLLRYFVPSDGPRPESYFEDYTNAHRLKEDRAQDFYTDIKSAAESGWDFSSRWFVDNEGRNNGSLTNIKTRDIIPVDLNAIFANALQNVAYFQGILHNPRRAAHWTYLAKQWRSTIEQALWNEEDGIWYDYDIEHGRHRKYFYPSNVAPLWVGAVEKKKVHKHSRRVLEYLKNSHGLDFPGGVPTSLINSGEQWDFPNAWPPLVSIVVNALEALGNQEAKRTAFDVAQTWVRACHKGYLTNKQMFEKYDAETPGGFGSGGEYVVQEGFGWSNGVVLEFLAKYGRLLTADDSGTSEGLISTYGTQYDNDKHLKVIALQKDISKRS